MRITISRVVMALGLGAAVAGAAWFLMPRPVPVETAAVAKGRFVATVDEDGKTRVRERYVVAAPLAGRLTRVGLKAGDKVASDEVVAAIMPPNQFERFLKNPLARMTSATITRPAALRAEIETVAKTGIAKTLSS